MNKLSERMVRLLNMVPYLRAHPGVSPDKAATDLGLTKKQLMADLDSLFYDCGLPGHVGGDLIDLAISEDALSVTFTAGMDRPLRLTSSEAAAVLVALQALAELPGLVDPAAARSAIVKIESVNTAAGSAAPPAPEATAETPAVAAIRTAVQQHRALAIDYYSASRDTSSHRIVDPIRVVVVTAQSYLEAWCRTAESVRLFRFDRVDAAEVLDEPSAPPDPALRTDTSLFDADPSLPSATLLVEPSAFWMFDYHPMKLIAERPDGSREASITYASDEWMTRLVLGFGSAVRVLAPESLATRVRDAAVAALAAYQS